MVRPCLFALLLLLAAPGALASPPETEALALAAGTCTEALAPGAGPAWRPSGQPRFLRLEQAAGGAPVAVYGVLGCVVADRVQPALGLRLRYALEDAGDCAAPQPCGGEARITRLLLPGGQDAGPRHLVPLALEMRLPARYRTEAPRWTVTGHVDWCTAGNPRACLWADGRPRRARPGCAEDEWTPLLRDPVVRRQPGGVAVRALVGSNVAATLERSEAELALLGPDGALLAVASRTLPVWSGVRPFPAEGCNPLHWTSLEMVVPLPPGAADRFAGALLMRFAGAYVLPTDDRRGEPRWISGTRLAQAALPAAARRH